MSKTIFRRIQQDLRRELEEHDIICLRDVKTEEIRWLWEPYIPLGKLTLLQGDPGLGKTTFAIQVAAMVTVGDSFPFVENSGELGPGKVLFQTAEDGLGDTIRPRLERAGGDCRNVFTIDEGDRILTLDDNRLRETIHILRPRLVIIDPLQAYLGAHKNMNQSNEMRPIFKQLSDLAAEFGCAIVAIGHLNKSQGVKAAYRSLGRVDNANHQ